MTIEKNTDKRSSRIDWNSLTVRTIIIGIIALVMLIPLGMVSSVVSERSYLYQSVLDDIASNWGRQQVLLGPVLVIPYTDRIVRKETVSDKDGNQKVIERVSHIKQSAIFLPDSLRVNATLNEQFRKRGLYNSLVYTADIQISSEFSTPKVKLLSENISKIHWDKAYLTIGLSDTRAINSVSSLSWDAQQQKLSPGTQLLNVLQQGFHAQLGEFNPEGKHQLELTMNVNGSNGFRFAPFGESTHATIRSDWPHPSFQGSVLPAKRDIGEQGFSAQWEIPHLARNYPQSWVNENHQFNLYEFTTGVDMFEPVSLYSQITRSTKYGVLFIGLTFLTFLIFELTIQARLHFVQYGLIGIALSLFFLILLSFSEHITFFKAYFAAAATTVGMITLYTAAALKSMPRTAIVLVLLTSLYIVLYSLLRLEDYALLVGTLLLVLVVMVLMYVTRNLEQQKTN